MIDAGRLHLRELEPPFSYKGIVFLDQVEPGPRYFQFAYRGLIKRAPLFALGAAGVVTVSRSEALAAVGDDGDTRVHDPSTLFVGVDIIKAGSPLDWRNRHYTFPVEPGVADTESVREAFGEDERVLCIAGFAVVNAIEAYRQENHGLVTVAHAAASALRRS